MWQKNIAFYQGKENGKGFNGYIADENLLLILSIPEGVSREEGDKILQAIKIDIDSSTFNSLAQFELKISEAITGNNLPTDFSLAAMYIKNDLLYLKTSNLGDILIYRHKKLAKIVDGEKTASGYINKDDMFILTTDNFIDSNGGESSLHKLLDSRRPSEIVDELMVQLSTQDTEGAIALIIKFDTVEIAYPIETQKVAIKVKPWESFMSNVHVSQLHPPEKKKTLTFIVVGIIFLIFMWSVVFGVKRRQESNIQAKVTAVKNIVIQKLSQADEVAFLDLSQATVIIGEAKDEVSKLKGEIGDRKEVDELENTIATEENKILKKEDRNTEEFYDLTIDNQQAKGSQMYLDADNLFVLDSGQKTVYKLSISKKSLDKKSANELNLARFIASYQDNVLFYVDGDGIYEIDSQGKTTKSIDKDNDWGDIVSMAIYNGNIYLLDPPKDSIYKYVSSGDGYLPRSSYFTGGDNGLTGGNSIAIDSSVYVGFTDHIFKFTAGAQDDFKTDFPDTSVNIQKIYTDKNLDRIYAWNKQKGSIYILAKDGTYQQDVSTSVLKQASDFVVYDNAVYILQGAKIYKLSL